MLDKSSRTRPGQGDTDSQQPSDLTRLLAHIEENPWHYVAGGAFILFCLVAGFLFRLERTAAEERIITQYAEAMAEEDLEARIEALAEVAERRGSWGEEAQYMIGETALRLRDYDRAEAAFQALLDRNANSEFAPEAMEGIAFIAENRGNFQEALSGYQAIVERYGNTFIARRQPFHIGRVLEELGEIEAAIDAYQEQLEIFPDSFASMQAEMALTNLHEEFPDLFPEEALEEALEIGPEDAAIPMTPALEQDAPVVAPAPIEAPETETDAVEDVTDALEDAATPEAELDDDQEIVEDHAEAVSLEDAAIDAPEAEIETPAEEEATEANPAEVVEETSDEAAEED